MKKQHHGRISINLIILTIYVNYGISIPSLYHLILNLNFNTGKYVRTADGDVVTPGSCFAGNQILNANITVSRAHIN